MKVSKMKRLFLRRIFLVMAILCFFMSCNPSHNKNNERYEDVAGVSSASNGENNETSENIAGLNSALNQTDFGPSLYETSADQNMNLEQVEFAQILKKNPYGILANHNGETIRTQIFQCLFTDGPKVYFGTSSTKPVYEQLQANPNVAFCTYLENYIPVLSVYGKVVFVEDRALKTRAINEVPIVKSIFETPDNPIFKMFYIDIEQIETFTYAEGAKIYER
jgi:uncharacterized pyridoxamine 5'-phosphate oxidase family protein